MNFENILAPADATRVCHVLEKFANGDLPNFALTGRLALAAQMTGLGQATGPRTLNDVDIVVESFASIPGALAKDFLVRHLHPQASEGKILIQLVDPQERLRIDIFRVCGASMERCHPVCFGSTVIKVISLEDLAARAARQLMGLEQSATVARKHARDFESLLEVIHLERVESAWQDHRQPGDPATFRESSTRLRTLIELRGDLLVGCSYSRDTEAVCPRCEEVEPFRLASPEMILSILGYC